MTNFRPTRWLLHIGRDIYFGCNDPPPWYLRFWLRFRYGWRFEVFQ